MTGENYTNTFGGQNVNPANLSYVAYTISANLQLSWAFEAAPNANVTADKIDVNSGTMGLSVTMPPANQVTVGQDVLFGGVGTQSYSVLDNAGNLICVVTSGTEWYIYLTDNTTAHGIWRSVQFGASVSAANAAALAGAGLRANVTLLDQNLVTNALLGDYTITSGDRAQVLQNGGGSVVYTFPSASTVANGFFVYVINAGTGNITLTPTGGQTIDGSATKVIAPTETLIAFSDGSNWHSLGYGRSLVNTVTGAAINAAGSGVLTLNSTQVAAQVQDFTGALTGNRIIEYGAGIGYWFVYNNTTGAFSFTARVNGIDTGTVVAQGSFSILRSNGTNLTTAFTATTGTVTSVATTANLTGGPISTTGTLDLSDTAATPGTYGAGLNYPSVTVDQKGRITSIGTVTLGSAAALTAGTAAGNVPVLDAGGNVPSLNGGMQPGDIIFSVAGSKSGFVFANGTTIGSAASAGTQRANADTVNLFTVLWNNWANAQAAVSGGRGANAAADFAANKTIAVPDLRGMAIAGMDIINGSANANRLSSILASTTPGATGGAQSEAAGVTVTVTGSTAGSLSVAINATTDGSIAEVPSAASGTGAAANGHTHNLNTTAFTSGSLSLSGSGSGATATVTNVQPTIVMNPFIKL